ncbi:MAG: hypothetical protein IAG13_18990 [Deltaproteobacteria bacterium]|nr:hypothetical protein [Nannocystaceae bacterium]
MDTSLALASSATRRAVRLTYEVVNQNVTNSQMQGGWITIGSAAAVTTGTSGDLATAAAAVAAPIAGAATALETGTSARVVEISVQHSVSSAQIEFVKRYAFVELAPT